MKNKEKNSIKKKNGLEKFIICVIIFFAVSYSGAKDYLQNGLKEQRTHETMVELGLRNYAGSGVVWAGCYPYFNDSSVVDLLYKTRDCKLIKSRGAFYPGHNKYDYMRDTGLTYIIGDLWKPNQTEIKYILKNYTAAKFKDVAMYKKIKK